MAESLDPATTSSAVARRYGLHASQLFVWRQQLAASAAREAPKFVPVVVAEGGAVAPAEMAGQMEIVLGPAVVEERESSLVLFPGSSARVDAHLNMVITLTQ